MSQILDFHKGLISTPKGTMITDVASMTFDQINVNHEIMPWLFPTTVQVASKSTDPLMTQEDIDAINADPNLLAQINTLFLTFLGMLGLSLDSTTHKLVQTTAWATQSRFWYTVGHLFGWTTRVILSMAQLGMVSQADAIISFLTDLYNQGGTAITDSHMATWQAARNNQLS